MNDLPHEYEEALECLEQGDFKRAQRLGRKLIEQRFSGGFEVVARAHYEQDQLGQAIKVLREGVEEAPSVWLLWVQLGNYLSDKEEYAEALEAYRQARECPDVDEVQVDLNEAVLRERRREPSEVVALCQRILEVEDDVGFVLPANKHLVRALVTLDRIEQAHQLVAALELPQWDQADILTELAETLLECGQRQEAVKAAREAVRLHRSGSAVNVLRLVEGDRSPNAKAYHFIVEGEWDGDEPDDPGGFFIHYEAVASSEKEAFEMARAHEREGLRASLRLDEIEMRREIPGAPKGLVWVGGFIFFTED